MLVVIELWLAQTNAERNWREVSFFKTQ